MPEISKDMPQMYGRICGLARPRAAPSSRAPANLDLIETAPGKRVLIPEREY
jgi:hypothetical protein